METTAQAIASELKVARQLGGWVNERERNAIIARVTLMQDIGQYSDSENYDYGLDDATRDRLIAHARQDAAQAALNTRSLMASRAGWLDWLTIINTLLLAVLLYRSW